MLPRKRNRKPNPEFKFVVEYGNEMSEAEFEARVRNQEKKSHAKALPSHAEIHAEMYQRFAEFHAEWVDRVLKGENLGAFAFLPSYDLDWEWWSLDMTREYIQEGGLDDGELLNGLKDFDFGKEFLVLVIEHVDGPEKQKAHFHRMSKVRVN